MSATAVVMAKNVGKLGKAYPYAPCMAGMVSFHLDLGDLDGKCWQICHTWSVWVNLHGEKNTWLTSNVLFSRSLQARLHSAKVT